MMPTPFQTAMMVVGSLILLLCLAIYLTEAPGRARWIRSEVRSLSSARRRIEMTVFRIGWYRSELARLSPARRRVVITTFVVTIIAAIPLAVASLSLAVVALVLGLSITVVLLFSRKEARVLLWRDTESPVHRGGDTSVHSGSIIVARIDVSDILDPVTGTGFDDGELAWRCTNCQMFYHDQTHSFLREQNSSRCVGCGQSRLERSRIGVAKAVPISPERPVSPDFRSRIFDTDFQISERIGPRIAFEPSVVTLHEVSQYVGQIVYFQGRVVEVVRSRATGAYCVKFQPGSWPRVFKLVIFRNYVDNFRSSGQTIEGYEHRTIRVRGLIQRHPEWGLEILVYNEGVITVVG